MLPNFLINCLFSTSLNLLPPCWSKKQLVVQILTSDLYELDSCCSLCTVGKESTFCVTLSTTVWYIPQHANSDNEPIQVINWLYTDWWPISSTHCICLVSYSEVPNKHATFLILFEKKIPPPAFFTYTNEKKMSHFNVFSPIHNEKNVPPKRLLGTTRLLGSLEYKATPVPLATAGRLARKNIIIHKLYFTSDMRIHLHFAIFVDPASHLACNLLCM